MIFHAIILNIIHGKHKTQDVLPKKKEYHFQRCFPKGSNGLIASINTLKLRKPSPQMFRSIFVVYRLLIASTLERASSFAEGVFLFLTFDPRGTEKRNGSEDVCRN